MFRRMLVLSVVFAVAAGPLLCCCTVRAIERDVRTLLSTADEAEACPCCPKPATPAPAEEPCRCGVSERPTAILQAVPTLDPSLGLEVWPLELPFLSGPPSAFIAKRDERPAVPRPGAYRIALCVFTC